MNYDSFSREQIISALKSLKTENATLLNTITSLKKELKDLKGRCKNFEGSNLDNRQLARRSMVH